jgi:hypothetical protein
VNLDEAMKEESDSGDDVIRISGNQCPEFPEPTLQPLRGIGVDRRSADIFTAHVREEGPDMQVNPSLYMFGA